VLLGCKAVKICGVVAVLQLSEKRWRLRHNTEDIADVVPQDDTPQASVVVHTNTL
jgi:hypothetical protein